MENFSEEKSSGDDNISEAPRPTGDAGRCTKQASKKVYGKKRRFYGNQHSSKLPKPTKTHTRVVSELDKTATISSKKTVREVQLTQSRGNIEGYRLVDMTIFQEIIELLMCPECKHQGGLYVEENSTKRKGLSSCLLIKCSHFGFDIEKYTSRTVQNSNIKSGKSFQKVENIYPGITVMKYGCLGHYQKRVGNRLRKLRSKVKGLGGKAKSKEKVTTTKDGNIIKTTEVANIRLTDAMIDMLQNYFGIALRSGAKSVPELKVALLASFFHIASSKTNNFHTNCPETPYSWCQYKRDIIN